MSKCSKCKSPVVFEKRPKEDELFGAPCDNCKVIFCKSCAAISTTEAHAIALSQRILIFYCSDCKLYLNDLPHIKKIIEQLEKAKCENKKNEASTEQLIRRYENRISELHDDLDKLRIESKEKDTHIKRLKRNTQDFENNVFSTEQDYLETINGQKLRIESLNEELLICTNKNKQVSDELQILEEKNAKLSNDLNELAALKGSMLISIEALTKDNEVYMVDLKKSNIEILKLHDEVRELKRRNSQKPPPRGFSDTNMLLARNIHHHNFAIKRRLLIMGNRSCVSGMGQLFKANVGNLFDINTQYRNRWTISTLVEELSQFSSRFTKDDFVILFTGKENAVGESAVSQSSLEILAEISTRTNMIIVGPPYARDRHILNKFIYETNLIIYKEVHNKSSKTTFLSLDNFTDVIDKNWFAETSYRAKCKIANYIGEKILNIPPQYTNQVSGDFSSSDQAGDIIATGPSEDDGELRRDCVDDGMVTTMDTERGLTSNSIRKF